MSVVLATSRDCAAVSGYAAWVAILPDDGNPPSVLDPARRRGQIAAALEQAFDEAAPAWWALAKALSEDDSAGLAHAPACVANASDLGLMMAWTSLVRMWAREDAKTLVVCDDPWLFRHLAQLPDVSAGRAPALMPRLVRFALRGLASRLAVSLRVARYAFALRRQRRQAAKGGPVLLVYGHPASTTDGRDGYFGDLLKSHEGLSRVLHVDCNRDRAEALSRDRRTISLHAFGNPLCAVSLPFARWRPRRTHTAGPHGWLVRRAAAREGGTGQAAIIRWQQICQAGWLRACKPSVVAWPWENHSWERSFVRRARALAIRTVGYQHSVVGSQMLNYAPASNPDGLASLPDQILCSGEATLDQLKRWGVPASRLAVGGALRFPNLPSPSHDAGAPVFVALPFDGLTAAEMVAAARDAAAAGHRFVVKDHPMTPFAVANAPGVEATGKPLGEQAAVSTVVYAATTVGLEAILAGLPTLRFRPRDRIALNILPLGIEVPAVDSETLAAALAAPAAPPPVERDKIFGPVDMVFWRNVLQPGSQVS